MTVLMWRSRTPAIQDPVLDICAAPKIVISCRWSVPALNSFTLRMSYKHKYIKYVPCALVRLTGLIINLWFLKWNMAASWLKYYWITSTAGSRSSMLRNFVCGDFISYPNFHLMIMSSRGRHNTFWPLTRFSRTSNKRKTFIRTWGTSEQAALYFKFKAPICRVGIRQSDDCSLLDTWLTFV